MGAGSSAIVLMALLISGYLFNLVFHPVRYYSKKAEGQKLLFMAAASGLVIGAVVFLALGLLRPHLGPGNPLLLIAEAINSAIPVTHASRLLATLLASFLLAKALNYISVWLVRGKASLVLYKAGEAKESLYARAYVTIWRWRVGHVAASSSGLDDTKVRSRATRVYNRLTQKDAGSMAQILTRAMDEQKLVMFTLKSRKIYCGRVFEIPFDLDDDRTCIELLPSFSTWRDKDDLRMGDHRTEYPVIELWEARQRLYSVEKQLALIEKRLQEPSLAQLTNTPEGKKLVRRMRRPHERHREQLQTLIAKGVGGRKVVIEDWIKVIVLKEVESISFYDPDAYKVWFAAKRGAGEGAKDAGDVAPVTSPKGDLAASTGGPV